MVTIRIITHLRPPTGSLFIKRISCELRDGKGFAQYHFSEAVCGVSES